MDFKSIQDYYNYQESDIGFHHNHDVYNSLLKLREETQEKNLKSICSYELIFTDYVFNGGEIKPKLAYSNGPSYPNFDLFDDDFEYIKSRAKDVLNHKYKAKYNHLLWESKHRHIDYAKQAIDSYFFLLKNSTTLPDDNLAHHTFANYFKNLFILAQTINYKKDDAIQNLFTLLGTSKVNGFKEYALMKFILEEGKKINVATFQGFYDYANSVINNSVYPELEREYLQLIINLCSKLSLSPKEYHDKLAEYHLAQAEKEQGSFIVHDFYLKALAQYQKSRNKTKIEEVSLLVEKAKPTLDFKSVVTEYQDEKIEKWHNAIDKITDELIEKGEITGIYEYLILHDIFPQAEILDQEIRPVTFDLISVMSFDINRNVSKKKSGLIKPYFLHIQNFSLPHLAKVFTKGIKRKKICFETLLDFLRNNTWYGQDFTETNADGEIVGFNWIELLSPSLSSFFIQSEIDIIANKNTFNGYVLCIDSLTIKFEGLLREFSRHIGAQIIEYKEDGTEARISFEKLLENEKLKQIIPENDQALLKFLFTSQGLNLRNNVAHCFYQTKSYSPGVMFLLISALLRLGNYELTLPNK